MIIFAKDLGGNRIHIDNAKHGHVYYCEECGTRLLPKNQGTEKSPHYAHKPDTSKIEIQRECHRRSELRTENQMSEWHRLWQEQYPEYMREVVFKQYNQIFRADICREDKKEIIEFQHSKIESNVFHARNNFYNSIGYKVIWLFNFNEFKGKWQCVPTEKYRDFIKQIIRQGQEDYSVDKSFYLSTFGRWKPQNNRKVAVYFMYTYGEFISYCHVSVAVGSFDSFYPIDLIVEDIEEENFKKIIGIQ